jgi:hypothetical protein
MVLGSDVATSAFFDSLWEIQFQFFPNLER